MRRSDPSASLDEAELVGHRALLFVAENPARLERLLAETGIEPAELTARAGEHDTLVAVLGHILSDESMLLVFAAEAGIDPAQVQRACRLLAGEKPREPT